MTDDELAAIIATQVMGYYRSEHTLSGRPLYCRGSEWDRTTFDPVYSAIWHGPDGIFSQLAARKLHHRFVLALLTLELYEPTVDLDEMKTDEDLYWCLVTTSPKRLAQAAVIAALKAMP